MKEYKIRKLRADEIDVRVQSCTEKGAVLLLYKDARVDQNILDEVFGVFGWQRTHQLIGDRLYCSVSVYDEETLQWVIKQDVGTESNTEKEKGQASDSFKRACFNLGIGRELYSSPFIWVSLAAGETEKNNFGKVALARGIKFAVTDIAYNDQGNICKLVIVDQEGKVRFSRGASATTTKTTTRQSASSKATTTTKTAASTKPEPAPELSAMEARFEEIKAIVGAVTDLPTLTAKWDILTAEEQQDARFKAVFTARKCQLNMK